MKYLLLFLVVGCSSIDSLVVRKGLSNVETVNIGNSAGTGFYLDLGPTPHNTVISNAHVCKDAKILKVGDDIGFVVKISHTKDLCMIHTIRSRKGLKLGSTTVVGQEVRLTSNRPDLKDVTRGYVINPNLENISRIKPNLDKCPTGYIRKSVMEALKPVIEKQLKLGKNINEFLIQIKIYIAQNGKYVCEAKTRKISLALRAIPGMSGSPVLDSSGKVVGVVNSMNGKSRDTHSYAVTLEDLKTFIKE